MLSPEVWNFKPPPFSVSTHLCETEEEIFGKIKNQYFNHHVSITLPNTMQLPNDVINTALEDSQYYRVNKVCAAEFLKKEFLDLFLRKGQLTAISLNKFSDPNSLAIIPSGKLILSISQSNFQKLGIQDAFSEHSKTCMKKYFVNLDLSSDSNESVKKCEQVYKKLSLHPNFCLDLVLAWEPEVSDICPSSIAYYFSKKGYFVKSCDVLYKQNLKYNVTVPVYDDELDVSELIEWIGAFSLDCDLSSDSFLSTLKCPEKNQVLGQVMHLTFTGLFTQARLRRIISKLSLYVKKQLSSDMWISLYVQNFHNSVLNVRKKHLIFSEGDNNHTVIFKQNQPSLVYAFQDKRT